MSCGSSGGHGKFTDEYTTFAQASELPREKCFATVSLLGSDWSYLCESELEKAKIPYARFRDLREYLVEDRRGEPLSVRGGILEQLKEKNTILFSPWEFEWLRREAERSRKLEEVFGRYLGSCYLYCPKRGGERMIILFGKEVKVLHPDWPQFAESQGD